ncbi:MAG: pitrilysin family protein [Candidatus Krumholzibacteriia bacterium]
MNIDPYRDELPPVREFLPGGAVLLSVPMPSAHSVTLGVWLRTGSEDEPPALGGMSHFMEHIVFKGSESRSALEIATAFDGLGAIVDAFTTKDHVAFTVKVLPEYFVPAVDLLSDMLLRPNLHPDLIALEQDVVLEEIQEALDTPEDRLHDAFAARVYGRHSRGRPILGTPASVRALAADVLRREHRRLFAASNVVLSMAGNLDTRHRDVVLDRFHLPAPDAPPAAATGGSDAAEPGTPGVIAPADDGGNGRQAGEGRQAGDGDDGRDNGGDRLRLDSPILQSYFEIGNRAVSYRHDDRLPVLLLGNVLGGGMSSRVFQAVREREGLAYTVYTYSDMGRDAGLVSCAGSCSPRKEKRLEQVVREEYARVIAEGISAEELENNRAQIKSQLIFSLEGVSNQMARAAKNEINYGRFVPVAELVDRIDAIDTAAIQRCARRYFSPEHLIVATHGPGADA